MLFPAEDDEIPRVPQQQQQQPPQPPPAAAAQVPAVLGVRIRSTLQVNRDRAQLTAALLAVGQGQSIQSNYNSIQHRGLPHEHGIYINNNNNNYDHWHRQRLSLCRWQNTTFSSRSCYY